LLKQPYKAQAVEARVPLLLPIRSFMKTHRAKSSLSEGTSASMCMRSKNDSRDQHVPRASIKASGAGGDWRRSGSAPPPLHQQNEHRFLHTVVNPGLRRFPITWLYKAARRACLSGRIGYSWLKSGEGRSALCRTTLRNNPFPYGVEDNVRDAVQAKL